jgi:hypothetical protein
MPLVARLLACLKRAGVGTNGILECGFLSKNAHRTRYLTNTVAEIGFEVDVFHCFLQWCDVTGRANSKRLR